MFVHKIMKKITEIKEGRKTACDDTAKGYLAIDDFLKALEK